MGREELITEALAGVLEREVAPLRFIPTAGGCINSASVVEVGGVRYFVKWNDRPLDEQFAAEATGLRALSDSGSSLRVPAPLVWADAGPGRSFLVIEYLAPGKPIRDFDEVLGVGLAQLHRTSHPNGFGFEMDGYCGATPQPNGWMPRWADFYNQRRIRHQVALARKRGMDGTDLRVLDRLCSRLEGLIDDDEPPALIHGDLWSGNLHVAPDGRPCLIDPAAHYGH